MAKSLLLATTCLPACVTAAIAAPPAPVVDSWAGPYIGAYFTAAAGGGATEATVQSQVISTAQVKTASPSGDVTGSMVDLFVGQNWRFGNFVVGGQVEATISSNISLSNSGTYTATAFDRNGVSTNVSTAVNGTDPRLTFRAGLVGRAGFLARPDLLLYGLAGLEFGHFIFPDDDDLFGTANRSFAVGYTAGAGVEARFAPNWSVRAEYRYLHFGTGRWESALPAPQNMTTGRYDNINMQVARLGLVYRFGDSGPLKAMAAMPRSPQQVWADSWAGPYAGIYFGAGAGHVAETYTASSVRTQVVPVANPPPGGPFVNTTITSTNSAALLAGDVNGSMNELFLGYNWRNGKFVAGVQVEGTLFSDVGWKANGPLSSIVSGSFNGFPGGSITSTDFVSSNQKLRSRVGLIGRAGFLATPDLLLYGLGGVEFGNFVYTGSKAGLGGANGKWVAGITAGAGGEMRITDHWSLRGEYRYMHFDVDRSQSMPTSSASPPVNPTSTNTLTSVLARESRADFHVGKVGVVYKFEGAGPASAMAAIPSTVAASWADGWAGPYFGVYFGAGAGDARGSYTDRSAVTTPPRATTFTDTTAALAGPMSGTQVDLFAGYSHRSDRFVFGGQIEGTQFSDVSFKTSGPSIGVAVGGSPNIHYGTIDHSQRLRSMVGVVGRAGFLATPDLLLYGLGGLALGHFTYPDGEDQFGAPDGKWVTGYTAGAGGEMKIARHWSIRGEYRYLHFDVGSGGSFVQSSSSNIRNESSAYRTVADLHLGKVGLVYRIGDDPASAMAAISGAREACCDRWTGFSAGVYGAAGMGRVQDTVAETKVNQTFFGPVLQNGASFVSTGAFAGDTKGGTIDLFAGYNWRAGNFVVGGQAEATVYADVGLKSRGTLTQVQTSLVDGSSFSSSAPSDFQQTLRSRAGLIARAGILATPNLLLYGLAGAEFGHFAFLDSKDPAGGDDNKWAFGYTAGAGAELKLTDRWSLRGEYRYARFELNRSVSTRSNDIDPAGGFSSIRTLDGTTRTVADFHIGKLGVAYSFCYCE